MEGRLKLLESGGNVIKPSQTGGGPKKWQAKADSKGYNNSGDFVSNGTKRTRYE